MPDTRSDEEKAKDCQKVLKILEDIRRPVEPMIDEIIKFVHHGRRKVTDKDAPRGQKTGIDIYDGTALSAANLAADGIHGYLCSSSIHWFDFILPGKLNFPRASGMRAWSGKRMDEYPEVKRWLDDCEEVQYAAFLRSNFYDFSPDYIREGLTIGTASAIIEEDVSRGTTVFTLPHFRECYVAENQFGVVDTFYRVYKLTLRQLVQKFEQEKIFNLEPGMDLRYEKNPYEELEIIHATYPRADYDPGKLNGKSRPVVSMWLLKTSESKLIDEDGYYDLPTVTWRWRKNSDEWYGRSPAWDAYVDIMKANQQGRSNLIAGHKMVEPPMAAPEDLRGKIQNMPKGITYISGGITKDKMPIPLLTGIQLPYGVDQQERTDKAIKEHFHVDFFLMLYQAAFNKVELTATQVVGMQGEQAAVLGTRIGRFQTEGMSPIQDRVWNIEVRSGRMPEPPQILKDLGGSPIEIDYMGPLSQAQRRLFKIQGIRAGIELAAQISQVYQPALDRIDGDQMMIEAMEAVGFPSSALRDDDQVKAIRQERQKQEAMRQTVEMAEQASKATQKFSKPIEEGSPMALLTEGGQG